MGSEALQRVGIGHNGWDKLSLSIGKILYNVIELITLYHLLMEFLYGENPINA